MIDIDSDESRLIALTADIVSAYVSNNHVQSAELPKLLSDVHEAMRGVNGKRTPAVEAGPPKATSQEIRKSISNEYLISFEDGKQYKTLRRHLTLRGLSPEQYRTKWGLPADYPMTSAAYSEQRSELARALGLGQQRRKSSPKVVAAEPAASVSEASAKAEAPEKKRRAVRKKEAA